MDRIYVSDSPHKDRSRVHVWVCVSALGSAKGSPNQTGYRHASSTLLMFLLVV